MEGVFEYKSLNAICALSCETRLSFLEFRFENITSVVSILNEDSGEANLAKASWNINCKRPTLIASKQLMICFGEEKNTSRRKQPSTAMHPPMWSKNR